VDILYDKIRAFRCGLSVHLPHFLCGKVFPARRNVNVLSVDASPSLQLSSVTDLKVSYILYLRGTLLALFLRWVLLSGSYAAAARAPKSHHYL
jgi:hypothetical protein